MRCFWRPKCALTYSEIDLYKLGVCDGAVAQSFWVSVSQALHCLEQIYQGHVIELTPAQVQSMSRRGDLGSSTCGHCKDWQGVVADVKF